MVKVVFHRILSNELASFPKKEGQLILTTDTKRLYLDNSSSSRVELAAYTLTQDGTDGHKIIFTNPDGSSATITIPDNDTTYTGSNGITLVGTNFVNSGVREIGSGNTNGTILVNTNGTEAEVTVQGIAAMAFKPSVDASIDITSGTLAVSRGGTGVNTIASGEVLVGSGTNAITTVPIDTTSGGTDNSSSLITSGATKSGLDTKLNVTLKGASGGLAELDSNGKVPASQLPSFVDDVLEGYYYNSKFYEEDTHTTEIPAESGKIYVDIPTGKSYRWSGSMYVVISENLTLGETSSTAYRGDRGKTAYDHATEASRLTTVTASGLYKVASTAEGHIASLTPVQKSDLTDIGVPGTDTTYTLEADAPNNQIKLTPSSGAAQSVTVPYATNAGTVNNHTVLVDVPANAVFTDTTYAALTQAEIEAITGVTFVDFDEEEF